MGIFYQLQVNDYNQNDNHHETQSIKRLSANFIIPEIEFQNISKDFDIHKNNNITKIIPIIMTPYCHVSQLCLYEIVSNYG